jgi:IS605 OrfB family transposase
MLATEQGESDLLFRRGIWYLLVMCEIEERNPQDVDDVLGIDLGVTNIASGSDGAIYSSRDMNNVRYRHRRLQTKLQKKGTKATRRRLKQLGGQERRFARDVNHTISKRLVETAERTKRAISLEDLKSIRTRVRARRQQRAQLHSWSFAQLRSFIGYKARRAGTVSWLCWLIRVIPPAPAPNVGTVMWQIAPIKPLSAAYRVAALVMRIRSLPRTFVCLAGLVSCSRTSRGPQGGRARDKPTGFSRGFMTRRIEHTGSAEL